MNGNSYANVFSHTLLSGNTAPNGHAKHVHPMYGDIRRHDIGVTNNVKASETVPATLVIDSRRRNSTKYPGAGRYTFELEKEYRDVTQVELVSACLPNSGYNINTTNNMIYLSVRDVLADPLPGDTPDHALALPVGYYTYDENLDQPTTLLAELNALLNAEALPFAFAYNTLTQRLTVDPADGFPGLLGDANDRPQDLRVDIYYGRSNGADDVLGLNGATLSPGGQRLDTLSEDVGMPRNLLLFPHRYLTLKIRELERCEGNTSALEGSFAVIPLDVTKRNFTLILEGDTVDNNTYTLYFSEPRRIRKLEISIYDPYGNIYDFNGHDHYLVFKFLSLTRPHKAGGS